MYNTLLANFVQNSTLDKETILNELRFKAVRSSGPGGQNVNKVSTKVVLAFDITSSKALSIIEKERILQKLANRINKEQQLVLHCDESRSQQKNKALVIDRFLLLLDQTLMVPKKRKKTNPSRSATEKRLKAKKKASQKKSDRRRSDFE